MSRGFAGGIKSQVLTKTGPRFDQFRWEDASSPRAAIIGANPGSVNKMSSAVITNPGATVNFTTGATHDLNYGDEVINFTEVNADGDFVVMKSGYYVIGIILEAKARGVVGAYLRARVAINGAFLTGAVGLDLSGTAGSDQATYDAFFNDAPSWSNSQPFGGSIYEETEAFLEEGDVVSMLLETNSGAVSTSGPVNIDTIILPKFYYE